MTIRFLKAWGGYFEGQVVSSPVGETEANLVSSGFATKDIQGPTAESRSLTSADVETVVQASSTSAIVLKIPNDATLGTKGRDVIAAYQAGAGAVSFTAGAGVTLRGTAPTAAQYTTVGIMRVGANEWAYL
jgi:hypothetical protein